MILGCAVGFQRAVGGSRPLVAIANAIKPRIEVIKSLFPKPVKITAQANSHKNKARGKLPPTFINTNLPTHSNPPMITPESYKLMSNHLHGCKLSRDFAMDGEYTELTFTSICSLRTQCDPRARRGIPKGGRRQPPFGCHRQRDKTSNRGF